MHRRPAFTYDHVVSEIAFPAFDEHGKATILHSGDDNAPPVSQPFRGNSPGGSAFYTGDKWPEAYRHTFFLADAWFPSHSRWIQNVVVDADNQIIEIKEFVSPDSVEFPVDMTTDAQGYGLYIMDYLGKVYRISYDCNSNGVGDDVDLVRGSSSDCGGLLGNGIPDECEDDLNQDGRADTCEILTTWP